MSDGAPSPSLLLVELDPDSSWATFTDSRPLATLRWGISTLGDRIARATACDPGGVIAAPHLEGFDEDGSVRPVPLPGVAGRGGVLLWASSAAPLSRMPVAAADAHLTYLIDGRVAGRFFPAGAELDTRGLGDRVPGGSLAEGQGSEGAGRAGSDPSAQEADGRWLDSPWDLVESSSGQLGQDLQALSEGGARDHGHTPLPDRDGVFREGAHPIWTGEDVHVGAGVVLDTREGAILLERGVRVEGPARLSGPLHVGEHTLIFGGPVGHSAIGPWCKLRGEISESVLLGWTNKAHDGHLGHALLGRWVNLGAGTTNSDLRNDYGPVKLRLTNRGESRTTGLTKVGAFLGDHVKTGIGTLLTTGAIIGAGSQVAGGGLAPTPVAPFSWVTPDGVSRYRWDRFEQTTRVVMARRDCTLSPGVAAVLERLHTASGNDAGESDGAQGTPAPVTRKP